MYIIELTYEKIWMKLKNIYQNTKFLDKYYKKNIFICSGRKILEMVELYYAKQKFRRNKSNNSRRSF